jgi:hypothetical protein
MDKDKILRMAIQCQLVNTSNREGIYMDSLEAFAKLVLKEASEQPAKNASKQFHEWVVAEHAAQLAPVQEPVAWYRDEDGIRIYYESKVWDDATPLYTTPPAAQRPWFGLTDEEIDQAWRSLDYTVSWAQHRIDIARAIEAKLKEKNNG